MIREIESGLKELTYGLREIQERLVGIPSSPSLVGFSVEESKVAEEEFRL